MHREHRCGWVREKLQQGDGGLEFDPHVKTTSARRHISTVNLSRAKLSRVAYCLLPVAMGMNVKPCRFLTTIVQWIGKLRFHPTILRFLPRSLTSREEHQSYRNEGMYKQRTIVESLLHCRPHFVSRSVSVPVENLLEQSFGIRVCRYECSF